MSRDSVLELLNTHRTNFAQYNVQSLAVFGSVARDEARADSDVDILVNFNGPATFDGYMNLKFYLEDLLNCSVDLVTPKALKPKMKSYVEKEAIRVA